MNRLPRAPLQEVIFEIRWKLETDPSTGQMIDKHFELAGGRLQDLTKAEFPFYNRKIPGFIPFQQFPYQIIHQFWKGNGLWPVIQLGPGIYTVNDTDKNYEWNKTYLPLIKKGIEWLYQSYSDPLEINACSLRYIDSVKVKEHSFTGNWSEFIYKNLKIKIENNFKTTGKQEHLQMHQTFLLDNGNDFSLSINDANDAKTGETVLVWQTVVIHKVKINKEHLIDWVREAHKTTSDLFKEMTKGDFYDSFSK